MAGMDVEWGPEAAWGPGPRLDEFLLARIAEDERLAATAATDQDGGDAPDPDQKVRHRGAHASPFDPARVQADCTARRRIVLACRESRPDTHLLGARPQGLGDFPLSPHDQHQLAALTLALLALPYAGHRDYREEWRP
jgi:Family of unknown function (DUF6221)